MASSKIAPSKAYTQRAEFFLSCNQSSWTASGFCAVQEQLFW